MGDAPTFPGRLERLDLKRRFHSLGLRTRVVLCQLPLALTMLIVTAAIWVLDSAVLAGPLFRLCLLLHLAVLAMCALVPWERLPFRSFQIIPVLDFALIALAMEGTGQAVGALGLLMVFPVIWLSVSVLKSRILVCFACSLLVTLVPLLLRPTDPAVDDVLNSVLLPAMMLAISISVHVVANNLQFQRVQVEQKDAELRDMLRTSNDREQLLAAILETINVGVLALSPDGQPILMNRQQKQFLEPDPVAEAQPVRPREQEEHLSFLDADGRTPLPPARRPVHRALAGEEFTNSVLWMKAGSGRRAVSASARAIRGTPGTRSGSVVVFQDITVQLEALAAKDDFVSNVAHEFRTPLTSVMGYLELATEHPQLPAGIGEYLRIAERNAERLLNLVSDFLSSAAGTMAVDPRPTDLGSIIRNSLLSAGPRAARSGVTLVNEAPEPLWARIDGARISQVLDNLLSNAIKYSPSGTTTTVRAWADGRDVAFEVADNGYGMDEQDQAEAFTRFFRASSVRNTAIPGAGLGLLITRTIVESHGGSITLRSKPGAGTTFTVRLPGRGLDGSADGTGSQAGAVPDAVVGAPPNV